MKYLILLTLFLASITQAELSIAPLSLENQHGDAQSITENTQLVIFSHDMAGKDIVHEAIEKQDKDFLSKHKAAYVADIEAMPGVIAHLFAYPAMRKYPYNIMLDKDGTKTKDWPRKEETVSLLKIKAGKLVEQKFYTDSQSLLDAIKAKQ